jgi:hypothetical protein
MAHRRNRLHQFRLLLALHRVQRLPSSIREKSLVSAAPDRFPQNTHVHGIDSARKNNAF